MALFGDSPRFVVDKQYSNQTNHFLKPQTPSHVGPGCNFSFEAEDVRNGWKSGRNGKRQPMDSQTNRGLSRGDSYLNNTLTKDGCIVHKDRKKERFPGAGEYDPISIFSPTRPRKGSTPTSLHARPGEEVYMGSRSPRALDCHLHHGVLVTSSPRELQRKASIGPGSYFANDDSDTVGGYSNNALIKRSHNKRASAGNQQGFNHSNPNTPTKTRTRSRSTGHTRPKSADNSNSYFKRYTAENLKNPPSPILQSPTHRVSQHNYEYSDGNGYRDISGKEHSPSTPYAISPKRGIPIGRVYN